MQLARVRGTVVSTQKEPSLRGVKLLLLQLLDEEGQPLPGYEVAADSVGAGLDEWVLVSREVPPASQLIAQAVRLMRLSLALLTP